MNRLRFHYTGQGGCGEDDIFYTPDKQVVSSLQRPSQAARRGGGAGAQNVTY
jgi:hypothetical protein